MNGSAAASYGALQETGFSHGFGRLAANRELVEWMRAYNAEAVHGEELRFYGFDGPMEMTGTDSPRRVLCHTLDYLDAIDPMCGCAYRERIDVLLGEDAAWENPAAMLDPTQAVGLSPEAAALRIETEELIADLWMHRPELVARSDARRYREAVQFATVARQVLTYHARMARQSDQRTERLLGMRDLLMADNVAYVVAQERDRGKILLFAHNRHLQRGKVEWQLGDDRLTWWPAESHLDAVFRERYTIIGSAVGTSDTNGIGQPEPGTLEARLAATRGPVRFIPTHRGSFGERENSVR